MKIWLAIPTRNPGLLATALDAANLTADFSPDFLIHANGIGLDWAAADLSLIVTNSDHLYQTYSPENIGVVPALQLLYDLHCQVGEPDDLIFYSHDDVLLREDGWDSQLVEFFTEHPQIGLVGLHGARRLGDPNLYKKPYELIQLARGDCYSNMEHAEAHGARTTSPMRVSTVDGFAMIARRKFLDQIKGWSWWPPRIPHHSYDNALCCMAARHGWETWLYPLKVHHMGGQTATRVDWLADFGKTESDIHAASHNFLYWEFKDVLPLSV